MADIERTAKNLKEMQLWPLARKIRVSTTRIIEFVEKERERGVEPYISFSGGKDSTVLLDIVRKLYPELKAVYCDTGLEYPEIRTFVKTFDNVEIIRPKMSFVDVVKKYGYPVISKEQAKYLYEVRHSKSPKLIDKRLNGDEKGRFKISDKWQYLADAPFEISYHCCNKIKKDPFYRYDKENNASEILGIMADESRLRFQQWIAYGCNMLDGKRDMSKPLSFWTEQDVCEYISKFGLDYCPVYGDLINKYGNWEFTGCQRTGCIFCGFGCHMEREPNRFQKLKETHPKQWDYCINGGEYNEEGIWQPNKEGLGMSKVLDYIRVHYK